ncbi:MAG: arginine--tRNA ligase [Bdellovibrionota bacterium]
MKRKEVLAAELKKILSEGELKVEINLAQVFDLFETPKDSSHGDIAFPCFTLAKQLKKAPQVIAQELASASESFINESKDFERVLALGPYVNFFLNKGSLAQDLIPKILSGEFTSRRPKQSEKVMVEYSQPNTHKEFHVGHLRCASLGDSIARIFDWTGHETIPVNYLGDEGTHVAKCLWYLTEKYDGPEPEDNRGEFLGKMYTEANKLLSLSELSKAPYEGVSAAKVKKISIHPDNKAWLIVELDTSDGTRTVVTAVKGFEENDIVAYAHVGTKVADKAVTLVERKGIKSEGMVCSPFEVGLSDENDKVLVLPKEIEVGTKIPDIYPKAVIPEGATALEIYNQRKAEVSKVLQKLESGDPEIKALWEKTKEWSMQEFYSIYAWLDSKFDHYFFESELAEPGKALVEEYAKKGVFIESEGAIGADLSKWNLGFAILLKSDGTANYATRDLALAKRKFEDYGIDWSVYVVDAGQTHHFQQVFKSLELMGFEQALKCHHQAYEIVTRPDGKMGSRKGNVIVFSALRKLLLEKINSEFLDKYKSEWEQAEIDDAAHKIALATMRYGMLNQDNNTIIVFDLDDWTSKSGNTGPYLLYAYARIRSILRDLGEINQDILDWNLLKDDTEHEVIKQLQTYHAVVERAKERYSPSLICTYLYELSKNFSKMYQRCSVLNAETSELTHTRAALISATGIVLKHGLNLLGIKTVERM